MATIKGTRSPTLVKKPSKFPLPKPQSKAVTAEGEPEWVQAIRAEQHTAFNRWDLFAGLLEQAAGLARLTARDVQAGHFDSEIASASIVLALEAVEPDSVKDLRGNERSAFSIQPVEVASAVAKRTLQPEGR